MQRTGTSHQNLLTCLRRMIEIRFFEEKIYDLLIRDALKGTSHLYAGEEAVAVGAISVLRDDDYITSTHRGHGHCHAHGDSRAETPQAKQEHLNKMMAELCGKQTGYSRGRGGSMHIADVEHGNLGATGIVGGNIPVATGAALSMQMQGRDSVVLCFFGDGATNTGGFHESVNMGATWKLPVVYIVENNLYGMSVPFEKACAVNNVADRAAAYGIPGEVVDGMDVLAVREAVGEAVARARAGEGPTLLECKTYRWYGHARSDPAIYRSKEEEAVWRARDPIDQLRNRMIAAGLLTDEQFTQMEERSHQAIETATEFAFDSPEPPVQELYQDVYVAATPSQQQIEAEHRLRQRVRSDPGMRQIRYWEALNEALQEEMDSDERVFYMGEDVGLYGGAYGVTRGLFEKYGPERIRDTAISEAAIGGAAVGAAMAGMRPVAEIMYVDFTPIAMDQIANQGAKNRYMFGGRTKVPMVICTQGGAGRAIAAHHSQSLEALWVHFPGIYVVMPATPYDAKGLFKACIRDDNPVIFIGHKLLYRTYGPVPEEEYLIPLGVADIKRPGSDVTVVSYSRQVLFALQAAEQLAAEGIEAEVIDLRCLKPLDMDTVVESVKKTGRLVAVNEAYKTGGFPGELIARICEEAFFFLDAPPARVAAADVPVPMSPVLEDATIPQVHDIVRAVRGVMA